MAMITGTSIKARIIKALKRFEGNLIGSVTGNVTGDVTGFVYLPSKTTAQLKASGYAAAHNGALVYCTDGGGGDPCLARSDGTKWYQITIGAEISTT